MKKSIFILTLLSSIYSYSQDKPKKSIPKESAPLLEKLDTPKNLLKVTNGLEFEDNNTFNFTPATIKQNATFYLGKNYRVLPFIQCPNPNNNALPQFINSGAFISVAPINPATPNNLTNASLSIYSAPWDGSGIIDVAGVDKDGMDQNGLLVNYFCHRNTFINTGGDYANGIDGGTVFLGAKVNMQNSLKIGWGGANDPNTSIEVVQNKNSANGVKVSTWNNTVKAYSIEDANAKSTLVILGSGNSYFGRNRVRTGHPDADSQYQFDGKIACKELVILDPSSWADYVFSEEYRLPSLAEVESFYLTNHHLPDIPSEAEVKENGFNVAEMQAKLLKKIEDLYLYVVDLKKEVDVLKEENSKLKHGNAVKH